MDVKIKNALEGSAKQYVSNKLLTSANLLSYIGQQPDQEVIRSMLRSIQIEIISNRMVVKFQDQYHYWFEQNQDITLKKMLEKMLDDAVSEWSNSEHIGNTALKVIFGDLWR